MPFNRDGFSKDPGSDLSADEIAQLLGYADAAAMVAAIAAGGSAILNGAGAPDNGTGSNGDYYLNTSNGDFYQKSGGAWGSPIVNLVGPQGPAGADGADGAQGPAGPAPSGTGLVQVASGVASTLALGTALHGVRVNAAGTAFETAAITATDSSKLPLAGGTMTGGIIYADTAAGGTSSQVWTGTNAGVVYHNVNLGKAHVWRIGSGSGGAGDTDRLALNETALTNSLPYAWSGTQSSAGNSIANMWRDSGGNLNSNVASGAALIDRINGSNLRELNGSYSLQSVPFAVSAGRLAGASVGQVYGASGPITVEAIASSRAALTAGGDAGGTKAGVEVYGASHTGNPGAVAIKSEAIAVANDGAWHDVYDLAAGNHVGIIWVRAFDNTPSYWPWGWFDIQGATLNLYFNSPNNPSAFQPAGGAGASAIALRISGGKIQANVGTSMAATVKIAIQFDGTVK